MIKKLIEIRKMLGRMAFNFSEITSTEGVIVVFDGDSISEGQEVWTFNEEGEKIVLPDGTYTLMINEKEVSIDVKEGVIITLTEKEEEAPVETENKEVKVIDLEKKFDKEITALDTKLSSLITALETINEAVLAFGSETEKKEEDKTIVVKDKNADKTSASKYFTKI